MTRTRNPFLVVSGAGTRASFPGWKGYMNSLPDNERKELAQRYNLKKFM